MPDIYQTVTQHPSEYVRGLHALLTAQLGLKSPLGRAVEILDRAEKVAFVEKGAAVAAARSARDVLARQIAAGERPYDEKSVREYDAQRVWIADDDAPKTYPAATMLSSKVQAHARALAGNEVVNNAPKVFDLVAAEATRVVDTLQRLPEPPSGLFSGSGDPARQLIATAGHEATYSTVLTANMRFDWCLAAADMVRADAGNGFEKLPDGAPRWAYVWRNWHHVMAREGQLGTVPKHMRLWWRVLDDWQPGVWRPADVETTPADATFGAKLKNLGGAVGAASGQPA
jgi:hypothetical protein